MAIDRLRLIVALPLLFIVGCGPAGQVRVYPVKGKVTFNGKPMAGGGAISFVPLVNQKGKTAGGEIKPDGTYEMSTYKPGDGSMVGEFRVVINQVVYQEPGQVADGSGRASAPVATVPESERIPVVYADSLQSPLTAKVEAKPNAIDIDLKRP